MPRSLRIEKENGVYHIINRGNYRQDLFINEGAHAAFEGGQKELKRGHSVPLYIFFPGYERKMRPNV
jgi:REP element-mobilizing transposase RayT